MKDDFHQQQCKSKEKGHPNLNTVFATGGTIFPRTKYKMV